MRKIDKILRDGIYRSRSGMILGVCKGIAGYFNFSVFWTRAIAIFFLFITGLWPITGLYFIAALLMKPEPVIPIRDDEEQEFYHSYVHSRRGAADRLKRRFKNLEHRIQRMEHTVTQREYDWESRLNT